MKHVAAYLLASINGTTPTAADVEKILAAAGIEADSERLSKLISELEGKTLDEVIAAGTAKLASVPSGGASSGASSSSAPASGSSAAPAASAPAPVEEESGEDMGFGLFD